tara:strand:- start:2271 stop:2876 length:606 start_codon:yes stop_codon:yes gene_type:complete
MIDQSVNKELRRKLSQSKQAKNQVRMFMEKQFKIAHTKLMNNFDSHKVTIELSAGPSSENVTGSLREGNLFGFIGFNSGDNPISEMRRQLAKANILIHRQITREPLSFIYKVNIPSKEDLYKMTPMPWATGSSWLRELEGRGIPNLGQYRFKDSTASRSGAGIQNRVGEGGRVKIQYITPLLEEFEKDLEQTGGTGGIIFG